MMTPPAGIPKTWKGEDGRSLAFRFAWQHPDCLAVRFDDRKDSKAVIPFIPNGNGGYKPTAPPDPYALFGQETLRDPGLPVFIPEGQGKAAALHSMGLQAVTSLGGANAPHKSSWTPLQAFKQINLLPDCDIAGEGYIRAVAGILAALPGSREVKVCRLPGLCEGQDVVDWLKARMPEWDGFSPVPMEPGSDIVPELLETIAECAEAPPPAWTQGNIEAGAEVWEPPVSLDAATIPPWPANIFAPDVQAFTDALAASTETPRELSAMMTLATLATAAQGRYRVRVKHDYFEPVNVWTCCAVQSGARKTAVWQTATAPLSEWERERRAEVEPDIKRSLSDSKTLQGRVDALRSKAAKAKDPHDVDILRQEIKDTEALMPDVHTLPQVWTADVTPENLAVIMGENHECMSLLSDEGGMLDTFAGRYSNGIPNLDIYLQGHAGSPVRVNRGSRPAVFLERPCLTIGICPQPDVVRALADKPGFRGRGLLARFLYAMPQSNLGHRTGNAPPLPDHVRDAYGETVRAMLEHPWNEDKEGRPCAHVLKLSPEAFSAWAVFANSIEAGMAEGGTYAHVTDWAGKAPGVVARIAAVLHVARYAHATPWNYAVDVESMEPAIRLGEVLAKHALLAFDCMGSDPGLDDARTILSWVLREAKATFTRRDCHAANKHRFPRADALDAGLDVLCERGHIRLKLQALRATAGRPSRTYEVNPRC